MGHIFAESSGGSVRTTKTLWELRQEVYAEEAKMWEDLPTLKSSSGREYKMCPVCHVPAWRRQNSFRVWYSHRKPDGTWCNGFKVEAEEEKA